MSQKEVHKVKKMLIVSALIAIGALTACTGQAAPTQVVPPTQPTQQVQPIAPALTADDLKFMGWIDAEGIGTGNPDMEIRRAKGVCTLFDEGSTFPLVTNALVSNGFTRGDAGYFIGAASVSYCPQHLEGFTD